MKAFGTNTNAFSNVTSVTGINLIKITEQRKMNIFKFKRNRTKSIPCSFLYLKFCLRVTKENHLLAQNPKKITYPNEAYIFYFIFLLNIFSSFIDFKLQWISLFLKQICVLIFQIIEMRESWNSTKNDFVKNIFKMLFCEFILLNKI